jgi:hypothetical protein
MKTISKYTRIKRTISTLRDCYTNQQLDKSLILNCLNNSEFQSKYVNY